MHPVTQATLQNVLEIIGREARLVDIETRQRVAEKYIRSELCLRDYLPRDLLAEAMEWPQDASVTWRVIRHLCAVKRYMAVAQWSATKLGWGTVRILITCELHLWAKQKRSARFRAAEREAKRFRARAEAAVERRSRR
jgi:hypothetical protein